MMAHISLILLITFYMVVAGNTVHYHYPKETHHYTDHRDAQVYGVVSIGDTYWFSENLRFITTGSVCYADSPQNCSTYGRLYPYSESRNACPPPWHLPSQNDIMELHKAMRSSKLYSIAEPDTWESGRSTKFNNRLGLNILPAGRIDSFTTYSGATRGWVDTLAFHQLGYAASFWIDDTIANEGVQHWHIGQPMHRLKSGLHRHSIQEEVH